jgi:hypothetical protein
VTPTIATIVEGHGEVTAVPALIARLEPDVRVAPPARIRRSEVTTPERLVRMARIARANISGRGGVLLIVDADEDCAVELASGFRRSLGSALPDVPFEVALAVREFESWIVGGTPELGVDDPDAAGSAKRRLREHFGQYSPTADQKRLIKEADIELLSARSRSFRHLRSALRRLVEAC